MSADLDNTNWFQWLLGGFALVLGWLGIQLHKKAYASVSRAELAAMLQQLRQERLAMHEENKASLVRVHQRLDQLFRAPPP